MKLSLALAAVLGLVLGGLTGCGIGPRPQLALPAVAPTEARLVFYRTAEDPYAGLTWTKVMLNGVGVGQSAPGTVFYRDVAPGTYRITLTNTKLYPDQFKTVVVAPGSETFVRIDSRPYWANTLYDLNQATYVVNIVDPAIGHYQIGALKLITG